MSFLDFLKGKKQNEQNKGNCKKTKIVKVVSNQDEIIRVLEQEMTHFFPENGVWDASCNKDSGIISYKNLPCNLRNTEWLSQLMHNNLMGKDIYISKLEIQKVLENSKKFTQLRANYELSIVRNVILTTSKMFDNWALNSKCKENSLFDLSEVDKAFRECVVRTLIGIGIDKKVVEQGLEVNSELWQNKYMLASFKNIFEPAELIGQIPFANVEHKENWMKYRRFEYYLRHSDSVEKYGIISETPMTKEEATGLRKTLMKQNDDRLALIEKARKNLPVK